MFSVSQLSVQFSGEVLFDGVSFIINKRDRIGLVGKNGAGKTTLMRILCGEMQASQGEVAIPAGASVGYLPQELSLSSRDSVREECLKAFVELGHLEEQIQRLTRDLAAQSNHQNEQSRQMAQQLAEATERFHLLGGHTREARAEKVLMGLGFLREEMDRPMHTFSGGWQMRVMLARILLQQPALLLLDEPTNHLDMESMQWLETFLSDYPGALMLVSHDRAFLDNITDRTMELALGKIHDYKACYSDYELLRVERRQKDMAAFNNQQRQIAQVQRFITRFRAKNTKASQVQSKIKLLEKMEKVEVEDVDTSAIHFRFPEPPPSGKIALEARHLSKSFNGKRVLNGLNFIIGRGERIAFVGRNGEGKTTLSRIIAGELPYEGELLPGHQVRIGYYAQNQGDILNPEHSVLQVMDEAARGEVRKQIRSILGGFLFGEEEIDKKVRVLSGGEKSRLAIARLMLEPVNLLVLDEPTNHLDMRSKDILKNALLQYRGTLIVVSHDRDFLQGLTGQVFEFRNQSIKTHIGDIYSFIRSRSIRSLNELDAIGREKKKTILPSEGGKNTGWAERKQAQRQLRKAEKQVAALEQEIGEVESLLGELEQRMADPSQDPGGLKTGEVFSRYASGKQRLAQLMTQWEEALAAQEAAGKHLTPPETGNTN